MPDRSSTHRPKQAKARAAKWYAYLETDRPETRGTTTRPTLNTLDPATRCRAFCGDHATSAYLETVGDGLRRRCARHFHRRAPVLPQAVRCPSPEAGEGRARCPGRTIWPETFRAAYGEELIDHLPELLWELPDGKISVDPLSLSRPYMPSASRQAFADTVRRLVPRARPDADRPHDGGTHAAQPDGGAGRRLCAPIARFQLPGIDMLCDQSRVYHRQAGAVRGRSSTAAPA